MEIDIFTLCDYAQDVGGKLTIVGTFDKIYFPELPGFLPICSIATRIRLNKNETGEHSLTISILDSNEKEIIKPIRGKFNVDLTIGDEQGTASLVIGIGKLKFDSYGKYCINLFLDEGKVKTLDFVVKKTSK
jgi:hypothetical protein